MRPSSSINSEDIVAEVIRRKTLEKAEAEAVYEQHVQELQDLKREVAEKVKEYERKLKELEDGKKEAENRLKELLDKKEEYEKRQKAQRRKRRLIRKTAN